MSAELAPLMVVTDSARFGADCTLECLSQLLGAAAPGALVVQLRDRSLPARQRYALGQGLRQLTLRYRQCFIVNDRVDLALALGADGVHLGEQSIAPLEARRLLGPGAFVSRAWHQPERLPPAPQLAALNALVLSPVFAPRKGNPALGIQGLVEFWERASAGGLAGLYALGGVDPAGAARCRELGVGAAAMGAVFEGHGLELLDGLKILRT